MLRLVGTHWTQKLTDTRAEPSPCRGSLFLCERHSTATAAGAAAYTLQQAPRGPALPSHPPPGPIAARQEALPAQLRPNGSAGRQRGDNGTSRCADRALLPTAAPAFSLCVRVLGADKKVAKAGEQNRPVGCLPALWPHAPITLQAARYVCAGAGGQCRRAGSRCRRRRLRVEPAAPPPCLACRQAAPKP